jgi:alpha-ketoglutarate-dependent 2,4-dichlorophenoxyacetate dioxygenase
MLETTPLHPRYGLQVHGLQLAEITADRGYPQIRQLFEQSSLLYFADQEIDDAAHLRLGSLFGPREDRSIDPKQPDPAVSTVSNVKSDNSLMQQGEKELFDLQANMLWHTDSTFLPVPALANIIIGRVIPPSGTFTEFASTRNAWQDMPEALKNRVRGLYFQHSYGHSRRKINAELAEETRFKHWGEQCWKSVWTNPRNGLEALYFASHVHGIVGMDSAAATELIDQLSDFCTQPEYVYAHRWRQGDVLIWDERAMLHRGVPWDYQQARSLASICVSVSAKDGLEEMRYRAVG